jgi:hypothetical protein
VSGLATFGTGFAMILSIVLAPGWMSDLVGDHFDENIEHLRAFD